VKTPGSSDRAALLLGIVATTLHFAPTASGSIIFTDFEDVSLFLGGGTVLGRYHYVDFNGDGTLDAEFRSSDADFRVTNTPTSRIAGLPATPPNLGNRAAAIQSGTPIGLSLQQPFSWNTDSSTLIACVLFHDEPPRVVCLGFWGANLDYVGVQFLINGDTHYGWVEVEVPFVGVNGGTIRSFAYETQPGVPIAAGQVPEPSSAFLLGLGVLVPVTKRWRGGARPLT
jgi:hypothetical protein